MQGEDGVDATANLERDVSFIETAECTNGEEGCV